MSDTFALGSRPSGVQMRPVDRLRIVTRFPNFSGWRSIVEHALSLLTSWESFYVIVGSSAAALTGLQFVVIVLGAEIGMLNPTALRAFGSPTIVHLSAALLISAILSAPWQAASSPAVCLAIFGVAGLGYLGLVL